MSRSSDSVLGLLFAVGGVALFLTARDMDGLGDLAVGPGLLPMIIGVCFAGLGGVLGLQGWVARRETGPGPDQEGRGSIRVARFGVVLLVGLMLYIPLLSVAGFPLLTVVFVALVAHVGGAGWVRAGSFSAVITAFIYVVFVVFLRVPLPQGDLLPFVLG